MSNDVTTTDRPLPGKGLFGWLGRQVGYVSAAFATKVGEEKVYSSRRVDEVVSPADPNVTLRRTTIDEVIVNKESRQ